MHSCSNCGASWDSEAGYLEHVCPASGVTPTDPANLGPEFEKVSEAAVKRGGKTT